MVEPSNIPPTQQILEVTHKLQVYFGWFGGMIAGNPDPRHLRPWRVRRLRSNKGHGPPQQPCRPILGAVGPGQGQLRG